MRKGALILAVCVLLCRPGSASGASGEQTQGEAAEGFEQAAAAPAPQPRILLTPAKPFRKALSSSELAQLVAAAATMYKAGKTEACVLIRSDHDGCQATMALAGNPTGDGLELQKVVFHYHIFHGDHYWEERGAYFISIDARTGQLDPTVILMDKINDDYKERSRQTLFEVSMQAVLEQTLQGVFSYAL